MAEKPTYEELIKRVKELEKTDIARKQVEKLLNKRAAVDIQHNYKQHVYQLELEMQNEELRRVQLELEASLNTYSNLYNTAPIGYFTVDRNGTIIEANLTGAKLLGVEKGDLIQKRFASFITPDFQDAFNSHCRKVFKTQNEQVCELELVKKGGPSFYVLVQSISAEDDKGNFSQLRIAVSNITLLKRTGKRCE